MHSKYSKWELGLVHYITKFTILRFVISGFECISKFNGYFCKNYLQFHEFSGVTESEVNEFMIIGLGMGVLSMAFLAAILICHRKRKRKNHAEHPMLPSHAHFHTCESIGERFATSSSMDSVSEVFFFFQISLSISRIFFLKKLIIYCCNFTKFQVRSASVPYPL